jgi:hypothetical protein
MPQGDMLIDFRRCMRTAVAIRDLEIATLYTQKVH